MVVVMVLFWVALNVVALCDARKTCCPLLKIDEKIVEKINERIGKVVALRHCSLQTFLISYYDADG